MKNLFKSTTIFCAAAFSVAVSTGAALAQDSCVQEGDPAKGTLVEFELETGERLKGVYGGCQGVAVMVNHSLLGLLVVPRADIEALAADGELPAAVAAPAPAPVPVPAEAEVKAEAAPVDAEEAEAAADAASATAGETAAAIEEEEPEESAWKVVVDVGLNGSQGNSNDFYGTAGTDVEWKRPDGKRQNVTSLDYLLDMNGQSTDDQVVDFKNRYDWLFPGSPWRWYVGTNWLYSEDENWDVRGLLNAGPGYDIIMNDWTELLGFTGLGVSREFGGDDDDFHPEWIIGYDWKQKLTDHWKMAWKSTYFQKLDDGEFRFETELNFDYKFVEDSDLALRFGIKERYNSDPDDGDDKDDFTYWLSLVYEL